MNCNARHFSDDEGPGVFLSKHTGEVVLVHKISKDQTCLPGLRGHPEDGVVRGDLVVRSKDLALAILPLRIL